LMAGRSVGCQLFLVLTGRGLHQLAASRRSVDHFSVTCNLTDAATRILNAEAGVADDRGVPSALRLGYRRQPLPAVGGL
jgi:hypothetical protein